MKLLLIKILKINNRNKMLKIYIAHSREIDFINELYNPLKNNQ